MRLYYFIALILLLTGCRAPKETIVSEPDIKGIQPKGDLIATKDYPKVIAGKPIIITPQGLPPTPDSTFVDLKNYSTDFVYDMKYATTDNFLESQVYECAECFLRQKTVLSLIEANQAFMKIGYRIKIFDCYRPLDIQKKMWAIVSNPDYVANPSKGSIHNRGGAVDITLVDQSGNELDMGTGFDHFGPEAAIGYEKLPEKVKSNRKLLQDIMGRHGFSVLRSEWWHFNFEEASSFKISNFKWDCR